MSLVRKRAVLIAVAVLLVLAGVLVARAQPIAAALLPRIISLATGYDVAVGDQRFGHDHLALLHVHVSKSGEPVLDAARVDVTYSLRDLLPGSRHRYGVSSISIDHPMLTLVRHKDGSYNVAFPQAARPGIEAPSLPNRVPIALTVRIRNGAGVVRAPYTLDPGSRTIGVTDITLDADINSLARTHYTLSGAFKEAALEPFAVVGTIDVNRGYAMHHAYAKAIPMRAIANYFINSAAARILAGTAHNLDFKAYALDVRPYEPVTYHMSGVLGVANGQMGIVGLASPLQHIQGTLQLVDDTFFFNGLNATLDDLPVSVSGGIYRFSAPQYRLGIDATGDLSSLRKTFAFAKDQPVSGLAHVNVEVEGDLGAPTVLASLTAAHAIYRTMPFENVRAKIAYQDGRVMIAPLEARVHGAELAIRGMLTIGNVVHSQLGVSVHGAAQALPYAGALLADEPLVADLLLDGQGLNFSGFGALQSERDLARTAALVHVDRDGVLDVDPFWINTPRGSVAGAYHLNRKTDASAFWIAGRGIALDSSADSGFGALLPKLPPIDGSIDRFAVEGGGPSGTHALVGGGIDAHALRIAGVTLDRVHARFAGTLADAAVQPLQAGGPWGSIDGAGALSLDALAIAGTYHGTLQGLRPYLNDPTATGRVDGPAAFAISPGRITVQADALTLRDARVHGLPVQSVRGTLAVENGRLHVYAAQGHFAGGTVVAAGSYDRGIALVANGVHGADLRAIGLPLEAGTVSASGSLTQGKTLPGFDGGVAVAGGRVQQYAVDGSALVNLHGDTAHIDHVVGALDRTYAIASGDLTQLTSGAPEYAVHADIPAGDVAQGLRTLALPFPTLYSDGTYNAALDVRGRGLDPTVTGPINVVAGSVNGLPFTDAHTIIDASRTGVIARHGSVQVATTRVTFAAGEKPRISGLLVRAPSADLSDFNNFFDTGDTLDGNGSLRFDVVSQAHRISSNGNVDIRAFRYRNLPIGDTRASWSSAHNVLRGSLVVGGAQGLLRAKGSIAFAPSPQWLDVARNSGYHVSFDLDNLDTSTWLAAFGFTQVPLTGRLDADATIEGRYPRLHVNGTSSLEGGTVGPLPIEAADLAFSSIDDRIRIDAASVVAPGITAAASGNFGLARTDPLDVNVYLNSNDVPTLVSQIWRVAVPVKGEFESTVSLRGTNADPQLSAAFDANNAVIYGVPVPSIFGAVRWNRANNALDLSNAGVQFEHGDIALAGSLPLQLRPFGVGPSRSPVSFDLAVNGLDPSALQSLLGHNTRLGGTIDGQLAIDGTVGSPRIYGRFSLAHGSYVSDLERSPITNAATTLTFDRTQATVQRFSANVGTGSISASGHVAFGNTATGPTYRVTAVAHDAQLNLPALGAGALEGDISLTRGTSALAELAGNLSLHDATIPFAAFLAATQNQGGGTGGGLPFNLGFDLNFDAGKNVRVRGAGYGAGLDIGATGGVHLAGTLTAPTLEGSFSGTNGTLTYFDRAFRLQNALVTFTPSQGIIPVLNATGITHVSNPDPRIAAYSTDVTINVDGPINALKIAFSSNPPGYTNEQILAMIAPFSGLIGGVAAAPGSANQTINGVTPYGALNVVPGAQAIGSTTSVSVGQEAFNILNAQFTQGVLAPFENVLSAGLGVQNISLNVDYYGNVGFSATKVLGRTVNFIYSQTFGVPSRYSAGVELVGAQATSAQLSFYWTTGPQVLFRTPGGISTTSRLSIGQPIQGQSGFAFTLQRLYW